MVARVQDESPGATGIEAIDQVLLTKRVYAVLRKKIAAHEMLPGERVHVDLLARQFGVSRTPIKDALALLAADGLIEIAPRRGTFVARLGPREVEELFELRHMIEAFAAERIVDTIGAEELSELERLLAQMEGFIADDEYTDFSTFLEHDLAFHSAIVGYVGNRRIETLYHDVTTHMRLARAYKGRALVSGATAAREEHFEILRALRSGDSTRVRLAVARHISTARERFFALWRKEPAGE